MDAALAIRRLLYIIVMWDQYCLLIKSTFTFFLPHINKYVSKIVLNFCALVILQFRELIVGEGQVENLTVLDKYVVGQIFFQVSICGNTTVINVIDLE